MDSIEILLKAVRQQQEVIKTQNSIILRLKQIAAINDYTKILADTYAENDTNIVCNLLEEVRNTLSLLTQEEKEVTE